MKKYTVETIQINKYMVRRRHWHNYISDRI